MENEPYSTSLQRQRGSTGLYKAQRAQTTRALYEDLWKDIGQKIEIVTIGENQCGYRAEKSTTEAIFIVRQLQEKYSGKRKKLYHIFVDLEKAFDRIPRYAIIWALRRQGVPERLVQQVMALYDGSKSQVKAAGAVSEEFDIQVGVHQGSALSPLLFILVMEEATRECRKGDPWELLYADDLVLTADSKREVIDMFNNWRGALERRGLKVNISKTKLMVTGKRGEILRTGRYPCAVCCEGVGANSILCTVCDFWCHRRCSGLARVTGVQNFQCRRCTGEHVRSCPWNITRRRGVLLRRCAISVTWVNGELYQTVKPHKWEKKTKNGESK